MVLHGDEGGKVVGDSIVYENGLVNMMNTGGNEYLTYSAWHGLLRGVKCEYRARLPMPNINSH